MRTPRLITLALSALALVAWAGSAHAFSFKGKTIKGSGHLESRKFALESFDEITIGGAFEVKVGFGDPQQVEVTIDDNLWENLELKIKGGQLVIDWDDSCRPDDSCRIAVTVPSLKAMSVHGAADVSIDDFAGEKFRFELSGAAELDMNGTVDRLDIEVSGAGEVDTHQLLAREVKVRISGAGNADITVSEILDAKVSGVGNITYRGNPTEKRTTVSGLGNISAH